MSLIFLFASTGITFDIYYPRDLLDVPDSSFHPMRCSFDREPLGAFSRAASGRISFQEFVGGGLWTAYYETKALNEMEYGKWHAWKLSLRGNLTFKGYDPRRCYPIAYGAAILTMTRASGGDFDGTVTVDAVNGNTISISGLPSGFQITAGDYVSFDWLGSRHLVKFLQTGNASAAGELIAMPIDPWLRAGGTVPIMGTLVKPWCEMKMIPGSWSGERTILDPISFRAIQHLT